jgi:altronate hydrolase
MDTPGYDPVSATGQIAGGANLVCFTTGRGSVFGSKPVPTIKLATTSGLFERMRSDMDFNGGEIIDGSLSVGQAGAQLFRLMLDVASGVRTCSEQNGMGDREFVPWLRGPIM